MVLRDSNKVENSFRRLAENLPGIVYRVLIEDDNRTIFFNDMVQTMTGYNPEDLKRGKVCSIYPIILPEDRLNVINIVKDAIENNVPFEVEYRINNKSGEVKWFSERGRPIRGDNGNPSYIDGVIFDITNLKEVETKLTTSEKKFKTIFDESPIGIEIYDSNGKLVDMNEGGLEIFGISSIDDVRGFDLFKDPNVPKEHLKKLEKGQIIRREILFDFDLVKDLNLYETKKSGKIWIDVLISPLYLKENNTVSNYLVQLQEITERKITEQKLKVLNEELDQKIHERTKQLKKSEEKYKSLFEQTPMAIILISFEGIIEDCNTATEVLFGYTKEELLGNEYLKFDNFPLDSKLILAKSFSKFLKTGVAEHSEIKMYRKDGKTIWINSYPINVKIAEKSYILATIQDTTKRILAEQKLKMSEEKYRLITENANDMIFVVNQNMECEFINEKASLNIMGRSKEDLVGKNAFRWIHPEDVEKSIEAFKYGFETGEGYIEARFKDKKGIYHWLEVKGRTFIDYDGKEKALMISRDKTQQKNAEKKIIQEREKANLYLNVVEVILVVLDRDGKITLINKKGHELLGYDEGELIGKNWFEVCLPPHDRERVYGYFKKLMAGEMELIKFYENPIWAKTGEERLISWSAVLFKDENGNVTGLLSSGVDITERAIIEQQLIESETSYRHLSNELEVILDHIPALIFYKNTQNQFLRVNKLVADAYNLSKEELVGKSLFDLYPKEVAQAYWDDDLEVIANGKPKLNFEEPWETAEGRRWVSTSKIPNINEEGDITGIIGFSRDITERKKKEEEVRLHSEIMTNMSEGVYLIRMEDLIIVYANPRFEEMFGYDPGEMIGKYVAIVNAPTDKTPEETRDEIVGLLKDTGEWHGEVLNIKKDGTPFWCYANVSLFDHPEYGTVIVAVHTDITERRKVEESLRESEQRLKDAQVVGKIGYWEFDVDKQKLLWSDQVFNLYKRDRTRGVPTLEEEAAYYAPKEAKRLQEYANRAIKYGQEFEYDLEANLPDGSIIQLSALMRPIKNKSGRVTKLIGTVQDITARKITEENLKESEEKSRKQNVFLNNILEALTHPFYVINVKDYTVALANSTASSEDLEHGRYCYSLTHNNNKPCEAPCICPLNEVKKTKRACVVEHIHYDKEGNENIYEIYGYPILDNSGNVVQMIEYALDISDRKKAEKNLRKIARQWRTTFDAMSECVLLLDIESNILQCNQVTLGFLGKKNYNEIIGHSCLEIMNSLSIPEDQCPILRMLESNKTETSIAQIGNKWCEISVNPVFNDEGSLIGAVQIIADITERRKTVADLRESEERFRNLIEQSVDGVLLADEKGLIIEWNRGQEEITGLKKEDVLGSPIWDIMFQTFPEQNKSLERCEEIKGMIKDVLKTGDAPWIGKLRDTNLQRVDNKEIRTIQQLSFLIKNENKIMLGNFSRDITEQKQIQKEIQEKQAILESIFRAAPIGIGLVKNRVLIKVNDLFCRLVGYTPDELLNKSARIVYPSDEEYEFVGKVKYEQIYNFGIGTVETKFLRKDGKIIDVLLSSVPMDLDDLSLGVTFTALDITERKKVERELIESEEKFRTIAEQSFMGIVIIQDGLFKYFNQRATDVNGYSVEEIQNWKPYEFAKVIHPEDRDFVMEQARKKQDGKIDVVNRHTYRVIKKSGEIAWVDNYSKTINYKGRSADLVMTEDITDKVIAEQQLKESEEKFRTIAERTLMGILIVQDNQVKYVNEALLNLFEYSQKEIANWEMDDLTKLIHSEDLPFLREYREHLRSGETSFKPYYSYRALTKSGKMKWIDQFSKEIQYKGRPAELVTIMDITEKKEAEQELIKLNNLKSELLRRTSHELKTPLVSIKGFSDLLLELHRDKLDDYVIKTIQQIKGGCSRLESLVNDILKTAELESGTVELKKSKEDLSLLIKICVSELEGLSELRNHTINLKIPDKLICSFEKEQIYNVITNILINAIKFTPYNGKIEVKSEINNDFIIISIKDNGIGFTEEEKTQIFKQFGKIERYGQGYDVISEGSGLGLYISKRIVELHGGKIWLESEGRDKGSTFYFSFPII